MIIRFAMTQRLLLVLVFFSILTVSCQKISSLVSKNTNSDPPAAQDSLKLIIKEEGIYHVTLDQLVSSGLSITEINPQNLRLAQHGETVPVIYELEGITFYANTPDDRYYLNQPYILESGKMGEEMIDVSVQSSGANSLETVTKTVRLEQNKEYVSEARSETENDVWFWQILRQQETFQAEFEISPIENEPAIIRTDAWGFSFDRQVEDDHSFDLYVNDTFIDSITWDGQTFNTSESKIPSGILVDGTNTVTLDNQPEGSTFLDIIQVNWIELEYRSSPSAINDQINFSTQDGLLQLENFSDEPLILNINHPQSPVYLNGWAFENNQAKIFFEEETVVAASGPDGFLTPEIQTLETTLLKDEAAQADLIIITTENLAPALTPLVEHRESQDLSVTLATAQEIYDNFGFGEPSPESIRDFVTFAYENWQEPKPKYLLIVGDATTDFHGNLGDIPQNIIPSLIVPVQFSGETVSDSRLADVDGDQIPELAVGRWPVRTIEDVQNLVQRTINYENGLAGESTIFAADESEQRFVNIAQQLSASSQLEENQVKILQGSSTEEFIEEWNKGAWLTTYIGHGSISRWGKNGMFENQSVEGLSSETPPIVLQLTCLTGLFSHPEETSLSEAMLLSPSGPVLTVAATSLTLSNHQEPFALELLKQLQSPNTERIGDAFQEAKLSLDISSSDGLREISDTFALFGDPSTRIVRPQQGNVGQ